MKLSILFSVCLLFVIAITFSEASCAKKEMVEDPFTGKQVKLCAKDAQEIRRQMGEIQSMADMAKMQVDAAGIDNTKRLPHPNLLNGKEFEDLKKSNKQKNADLFN